ncbi:CMKLR1 [Mytilus edulis]|uniref:CMKLR1 n=1 Tax=Mytilus edulis TaxID=6550 RepID=A0A8S3Q0T7_MYTED|nr:CMKLR1 [Mytilus edulis]
MITSCLGIQKVIAILFPVWTKNELTKQKAAICCVICFLLSIAIGIPRHFSIWSEKYTDRTFQDYRNYNTYYYSDVCLVHSGGNGILEYSSVTYLLIQTVLLTSCCLVMLISTIFIVYKLITNKFRGRMTNQRRQERRSVAMVILLLMIFIITEVPKVFVYLWWCFEYINGNDGIDTPGSLIECSVLQVQRYEFAMPWWLADFTDMFGRNYVSGYFIFAMLMEGIRLFTIIGCMSNFIIYIMMSTKMRNEIVLLLKKIITRCTHKDQMNQIRETRRGRTQPIYETAKITTEQRCSHQIGRNTSEQQDKISTHEKDMNTLEQQGQSRTHEIEMDSSEHQDQNHPHEIELITSEYRGQSRAHEVEINTIKQPG